MSYIKTTRYAWSYLIFVLILSGCSFLDSAASTPTLRPDEIQATVDALVTLTMAANPGTLQPSSTQAKLETLAPGRTPTPVKATTTPTLPPPSPSPTATAVCDRAMAGSPIDVTIPDDSLMRPGQPFIKIWRLQNIGLCTWNQSYSARFFYGIQFEALEQVFLIRDVEPGDTIEITVDMVAPSTPGTYQGNWKLNNDKGQFFGIGPNGDSPFWVRIQVEQVQTTANGSATATVTPPPSATPTQTLTPTPQVHASGSVSLALNSDIDLDSGTITPSSGADLAYRKDTDGFHNLLPVNEAEFIVYGNSEPIPSVCRAATMSSAPIALESLTSGVYLCIRSDSDRYGWVRYISLENTTENAALDYKTWATP